MDIDKNAALIVTDIQNDFLPGGPVAVPNGDEVIPVLNRYIEIFTKAGAPIFFTRDWHPENHMSFKDQGGDWPPHCVRNTPGAEFHPDLNVPEGARIISKAQDPDVEAYSAFKGTDLADRLNRAGVKRVLIGGLATDYCVKNTVIDAISQGLEVYVLLDAVRGVDVREGDSERAIEEMKSRGAVEVELAEVGSR